MSWRYTSSVCRAVRFRLKVAARAAPRRRTPQLLAQCGVLQQPAHRRRDVIHPGGIDQQGHVPDDFGQELTFDVTTGHPYVIASRAGRPKPLYREGKTRPRPPPVQGPQRGVGHVAGQHPALQLPRLL